MRAETAKDARPSEHVDPHNVNERARLLSHRMYAGRIDVQPALLDQARILIDNRIASGRDTAGHLLWSVLLLRPWPIVRERMLRDDPHGRLLRSNSPFSHLLGVRDEAARRRLWQEARSEILAERVDPDEEHATRND